MNAFRVAQLRAHIAYLHHDGLPPKAIAARAGCALSTVYKVLKDPSPDRRRGPRPRPPRPALSLVAELCLLALADPLRSAADLRALLLARPRPDGPVPSVRTINRILRDLHAGDPAVSFLGSAALAVSPLSASASPASVASAPRDSSLATRHSPDLDYVRILVGRLLAETDRPGLTDRARHRLYGQLSSAVNLHEGLAEP